MSFEEAALLEPLSVCLHATETAALRLGQPVLITGAGPIGVVQLLCAEASGCWPIVITDLSLERLDFAKKLVPSVCTFLIDLLKTPQESAAEITNVFTEACSGVGGTSSEGKVMPAVTMECTGQESSIATAACE
jgi:L-iditol 2-dehydrogenase